MTQITKFKGYVLDEEAGGLQKRGFTMKEIEALLDTAVSSKTASSIAREHEMDDATLSRLKEREGSAGLVGGLQNRLIRQVIEALADDPDYLLRVRDEICSYSVPVVLAIFRAVKSQFERATRERPRTDLVLLAQALEEKVISSYSFKGSSQAIVHGITKEKFFDSIREIVG